MPGPHSPRTLAQVERRAKVYELRIKGYRYDQIAKELGIKRSMVHRDVKIRAKQARNVMETLAAEAVGLDLDRLETVLMKAMERVEAGDPRGMEVVLKILERRAKILGYDKPVTTSMAVTFSNLTGPELLEQAERQGLEVSMELRQQLAGATAQAQLPYYGEVEDATIHVEDSGGPDRGGG